MAEEFFVSYSISSAGFAPLEDVELAQPTGETITRTNNTAVYRDVLDEDGNPTGEKAFDHWEYYEEEIEEMKGGWILDAVGPPISPLEYDENGDPLPQVPVGPVEEARSILSTAPQLDVISEHPDVVEASRLPATDTEAIDG